MMLCVLNENKQARSNIHIDNDGVFIMTSVSEKTKTEKH